MYYYFNIRLSSFPTVVDVLLARFEGSVYPPSLPVYLIPPLLLKYSPGGRREGGDWALIYCYVSIAPSLLPPPVFCICQGEGESFEYSFGEMVSPLHLS
jgi:hypothetical protein